MRLVSIHPGRRHVPAPTPEYPHAVRGIPVLDGTVVNIGKGDFVNPGTGEVYGGSGGYSGDTRECIGSSGQVCPADGTSLWCLDDWIGGGSHYWRLQCPTCEALFDYDSYCFRLHPDGTQMEAHYGPRSTWPRQWLGKSGG